MPDQPETDAVHLIPTPDRPDEVRLYLPSVEYLDTQAGPVEIGLDRALWQEVVTALQSAVSGVQPDTRPSSCRCHSREGLTAEQHENDCPLGDARPVPDTERRERYAAALYEQANPGFLWVDAL
ncbi:hypothetical protein, partial [Streptomyces niveus]|uniref:hypothetical protein n=1 Tax=Streptomyces niveus TaxID=193462 RepID=UPI00342CB855